MLGLFLAYLFLVLTITLFYRGTSERYTFARKPFWSYTEYWSGSEFMLVELLLNIIMFSPIGLLMPGLVRKHRYLKCISFPLILTVTIEITQYFTRRGLFQTDDMIHNFLGALLGILLFFVLFEKNRKKNKGVLIFILGYIAVYFLCILALYLFTYRV